MIREEERPNGRILHCSDKDLMIRQIETGILYSSAEDTVPCKYSYEETDTPVPSYEDEISDTEALNLITGLSDE